MKQFIINCLLSISLIGLSLFLLKEGLDSHYLSTLDKGAMMLFCGFIFGGAINIWRN